MLNTLTGPNCSPTRGQFLLYQCDDLRDLFELEGLSPTFALFSAFNLTNIPASSMQPVAESLVGKGLVYACCWGENCELWHDTIDKTQIALAGGGAAINVGNVIMTTWHSDESLEKALWFFMNAAFPSDAFVETTKDYVIATSAEHVEVIRKIVSETAFDPD